MTTTCGTCRHWHQRPPDPRNLGAPAQGECRCMPPALTTVPIMGTNGPVGNISNVGYPVLPANYPACGQHAAKLSIGGEP